MRELFNSNIVNENVNRKERTPYYVYIHTCPNYKVYIGMTKNPIQRWNNGNGYKFNKEFYEDIKKYGWNNIKHELLLKTYYGWIARMNEKKLIAQYKKAGQCYNLVNEEKEYHHYKSQRNIPLKKIGKYSLEGELIKIYNSATEAWRDGNPVPSNIQSCCRGRTKTSGKYVWKYL